MKEPIKKIVAFVLIGVVALTAIINPTVTVHAAEESKTYSVADIVATASISKHYSIQNNILSYINGQGAMLNISCAVKDGTLIEALRLTAPSGIDEDVKAQSNAIPLSSLEGKSLEGAILSATLANAQVIVIPLSLISADLSTVTGITGRATAYTDVVGSFTLTPNYKRVGDTLYVKELNGTTGLKLSYTSMLKGISVVKAGITYVNELGVLTKVTDEALKAVIPIFDEATDLSLCSNYNVFYELSNGDVVVSEVYPNLFTMTGNINLLDLVSVKVDTTAPKVVYASTTATLVSHDGTDYVTHDGDLLYSLLDDSYLEGTIKSVKLKGLSTDVSYSINGSKQLVIPTSQFAIGDYEYTIISQDAIGNEQSSDFQVHILRKAPPIVGLSHTALITKDGKSYSKGSISLSVGNYEDTKISKIELVKDGVVVSAFNHGTATINVSGLYSVRVTNILNISTEYNIQDLFGDMSSTIIVDAKKPTMVASVNNSPINPLTWYKSCAILNLKFEDDTELGSVTVKINNSPIVYDFRGSNSQILEFDLSKSTIVADGLYKISVEYSDAAGNKVNYENTVKLDDRLPTLGSLHVIGDYVYDTKDDVNYVQGKLSIEGLASDIGSGVKSVTLERNGVLLEGQPLEITTNGTYSIKIEDFAGFYQYYTLDSLLGNSTSSRVVIDDSLPIISRKAGFIEDIVIDGKDWYKESPTFSYLISDANLKSISIKVNGAEKVSTLNQTGIYTISTEAYSGLTSVQVIAEDKAGHITKDTYNYGRDSSAPYVYFASLNQSYVERGGILFFKSNPTLVFMGRDLDSGIKTYHLFGAETKDSDNGIFNLSKSGNYSVIVEDKLGNKSAPFKVKDYVIGLSTNDFIIDTKAPTVEADIPTGFGNWYNGDIVFNATAKDDQGIKSIDVYINGQLTNSLTTPDVTTKSASISVDTSLATRNDNGFYNINVKATDNAGNVKEWSNSILQDLNAPVITQFTFTGDGYQEGLDINGSDSYGFYFKGSAYCDIHVFDGVFSSGLKQVTAYLYNEDGTEFSHQTLYLVGNVARLLLPDNFKGFISASAVDNVGNVGASNKPDGVITEGTNCFVNSTKVELNLPDTDSKDNAGLPLYSKDMVATAEIACNYAGLRSLEWGIGSSTLGSVSVNNNGVVTGDTSSVKRMGKNLVLNLSKSLSLQGNANGLTLWVTIVDKTGHTSKTERAFSIDKDVPEVSVSYDKTSTTGYYNTSRVVTISVKELNFDSSKCKFTGDYGTLGTWSRSGNTWVTTLTFADDKDYNYSILCTDKAGNVSKQYSSGKFIIDKTAPVVSVSWDNNSPNNGNFFSKGRLATVTVVEEHFDGSLYKLSGSGILGAWTSKGNTHYSKVSFNADGEYEFSLDGKDLAGNTSATFNSGKFIIDLTKPTISIDGVQKGVSYKGDVSIAIKLADTYINKDSVKVSLVGKKNGALQLTGSVDSTTGLFTFKDFPKEQTYDDTYTLSATMSDMAGNTVENSVVFSVNRFGSLYRVLDGNYMGTYMKHAKTVLIKETNVDRLNLYKARISVLLDGKELFVSNDHISVKEEQGADGSYNYTYEVNKKAFKEDGKYLIQVYSQSIVGTDYSSISEEYAFILDTTKPEVILSGIKNGEKYREYSKKVSLDIRDLTGVKDISVSLNGSDVSIENSNGVYFFNVKESSKKQNVKVYVTDKAGNTSMTEVKDFVVTSNALVFLVNQSWFKLSVGLVLVLILSMVGLILNHRRKSRKEEEELLQQNAELYKESSSATSSSLASGSEKDKAEDLEHIDDK